MALLYAQPEDSAPLPPLSGPGPHPCDALVHWRGRRFGLPPLDPRLPALHAGGAAPSPPWDNLVGAVRCWAEHPEWMDQLDPASPVAADKALERSIYLDRWAEYLPPRARVLDLGGGVGRFAQWLLAQDCEVELVDPDLRSLWAAMDRLAGGPGRLDLHWGTGTTLSGIRPVDRIVAAEVLCYVESAPEVLDQMRRVLKPGGVAVLSVEAQPGAGMCRDAGAPMDERGVIHVPGDRWVQAYTEEMLRDLLHGWELLDLWPSHYVLSGPLESEVEVTTLEALRAAEHAARSDPARSHLHRAWMAVVRPVG